MAITVKTAKNFIVDGRPEKNVLFEDDYDIEEKQRCKTVPTNEDLEYVATSIRKLSVEQWYMIYEIIHNRHAKLCTVSDTMTTFILDYLSPETFWMVYKYVRSCIRDKPREQYQQSLEQDILLNTMSTNTESITHPVYVIDKNDMNNTINSRRIAGPKIPKMEKSDDIRFTKMMEMNREVSNMSSNTFSNFPLGIEIKLLEHAKNI